MSQFDNDGYFSGTVASPQAAKFPQGIESDFVKTPSTNLAKLAGHLFEVIGSPTVAQSTTFNSNAAKNLQTILLTRGLWIVKSFVSIGNSSNLIASVGEGFITTNSTPTTNAPIAERDRYCKFLGNNIAQTEMGSNIINAIITVNPVTENWYLHGACFGFSSGVGVFFSNLYAIRIG